MNLCGEGALRQKRKKQIRETLSRALLHLLLPFMFLG